MAATKPDNAPPLKRRWPALDIRCQWLAWVCGLAAVTNVGFFLLYPPVKPSPDEIEYRSLGVSLAERGELRLPTGEVAKRMPLYPVMIAGLYRWLQPDLRPSGVLSAQTLLSWGAAVLIALTAARLAGPRAGWLAGTVAAFYSPFRLLQVLFLTETLLIFLLLLALYLYITYGIPHPENAETQKHRNAETPKTENRKPGKVEPPPLFSVVGVSAFRRFQDYFALLVVSLLLGLAVLTRANALLFLVPFALDAALRSGSVARRAMRCALILLPALACTGDWVWRNHQLLGAYTLSTGGGLNFYLGHNPNYARTPGLGADTDYGAFDRLRGAGLGEVEADRRLFADGWSFIVDHPGLTIANALRKTGVWLSPLVRQHGPLTPVLALGMILLAARRARRRGELDLTRRRVFDALVAAFVVLAVVLAAALWATMLPYTTPLYVVPLGLLSLAVMRTVPRVRGLFIGLLASQWFVAAAFIPLARLRWTVDPILIIAIGAAVSRLCHWLAPPAAGPRACGLGRRVPPTGETRPISDCDSRLEHHSRERSAKRQALDSECQGQAEVGRSFISQHRTA
jgi:Ca2+/Na+ antiporter